MLACCDWHMQLKTTHLNGWPGTGLRDFLFSLWHTGTGHGKDKMAIPSVISRRNHYPGYAGCYMLTCTSRLIWTLQGAVNDRQSKHLDYRADTLAVKKYKCNLCWCTSLWGPHISPKLAQTHIEKTAYSYLSRVLAFFDFLYNSIIYIY